MLGRAVAIAMFALIALVGVGVAVQTDEGTPPATGSPEASPEGSPGASPEASPVGLVGDVERGRQLAAQCIGCHSVDGSTLVGPSWLGLYGRTETMEDGTTVVVDEAYLHESIVDPGAKVVAGFPAGAMPPYSYLTEQQIADLIAYIKSLTG